MPDDTEGEEWRGPRGKPRWRCPSCGFQAAFTNFPRMEINLPSLPRCDGAYCLRCYAEWMRKNIPKLEPVAPARDPTAE